MLCRLRWCLWGGGEVCNGTRALPVQSAKWLYWSHSGAWAELFPSRYRQTSRTRYERILSPCNQWLELVTTEEQVREFCLFIGGFLLVCFFCSKRLQLLLLPLPLPESSEKSLEVWMPPCSPCRRQQWIGFSHEHLGLCLCLMSLALAKSRGHVKCHSLLHTKGRFWGREA